MSRDDAISRKQGSRDHARFLDRQDFRHHAGRNRWRCGQHELAGRDHAGCRGAGAQRLSRRHRNLRRDPAGAGPAPDPRPQVPSRALLGDDHRLHHRRHDARRLRHALARDRLQRRLATAAWPRAGVAGNLAQGRGPHRLRPYRRRPGPRRSTGSRSLSPRRSAPRSATGRPTRRRWGLAISVARRCSAG